MLGEELVSRETAREEFLYSSERRNMEAGKLIQKKLLPLTGITLISTIIVQELVREAVLMSIQSAEKEEYEALTQGQIISWSVTAKVKPAQVVCSAPTSERMTTCTSARHVLSGGLCEAPAMGLTQAGIIYFISWDPDIQDNYIA